MILVTGGTGFLGRHVVRKLAESGEKVRVLARNPTPPPAVNGVEHARGDISNPGPLADAMRGCAAVVHLVGIIRETYRQSFNRVHAAGTRNVVSAAKAAGVKKIVYVSALGARPGARSRYHKTKWAAEEAVRNSGIPWVILSPSVIVGPEDRFVNLLAGMIRSFPGALGFVPVIGNGKNKLQPIAVDDVAECVAKAAVNDGLSAKEYALTGPDVFTFDELLDTIMSVLVAPRWKIHIPMGLAKIAAILTRMIPWAPVSRDQLLMLEENNAADNSSLRRDFGIEPKPLEPFIRTYLR